MTINAQSIITAGAVLSALLAIGGTILAVVKWVQKQDRTKKELQELQQHHEEDKDSIQRELGILTYAMLATLDGLKQLHCNGQVTKAHEALEKHLNKQAHDLHTDRKDR